MPAMNQRLVGKSLDLVTSFYAAGIECPPLVAFSDWVRGHMDGTHDTATIKTPTAMRTRKSSARTSTLPTRYSDAVLAIIQGAPAGLNMTGLQQALIKNDQPTASLSRTLTSLAAANAIEKRGDLWYATIAGATVDRSLVTGRKPRERKPANTATQTEAGAAPLQATG